MASASIPISYIPFMHTWLLEWFIRSLRYEEIINVCVIGSTQWVGSKMLNGTVMPIEDLTHQNWEQLIHRKEQHNFPHQVVSHVCFMLSFCFPFPALLLPGLLSSAVVFYVPHSSAFSRQDHFYEASEDSLCQKLPLLLSCLQT